MGRTAAQDLALTVQVTVVVALVPVLRAKAIKVVLISNPVKEINCNSPAIRVIRSSWIVDSIMSLLPVYV